MNRPGGSLLVALVTVALVASSAFATAGAFGAPPTASPTTVSRLTIAPGDIQQTGADPTGLDLGSALSGERAGIDASYRVARVERRLEAAPNDTARREVIRDAVSTLETDVAELRTRERAAIEAYAAGEIGDRKFLGRLATLDDEAHALGRVQRRLAVMANEVSGTALSARLSAVDATLTAMHGPVRDRVSSVIRGNGEPIRVQITAGNGAVTLAYIDGQVYSRETLILANRNEDGPREITGIAEASDRATQLYPWADNHSTTSSVRGLGGGIFQFVVPHSHGQLTAYIDARTGDVFRETHHLHLDRIPRTTVANVTENDMRLVIERTFPGGPLYVNVTRNGSDSPIDGTLMIDGVEVATTGEDGAVWIHEPSRAYTLTAQRISLTVNATVDPTQSPYARWEYAG